MGSGRARKFAAAAVAALLLASVSAVLVATAAPKRQVGRAPTARTMTYACAWDLYNAKKVLHFVARPSSCRGSGRKLVNWRADSPVFTCRKEHGGFAARQKHFQFPNGIYGHGPAGLMRWVSSLSQCAPKFQRNETPHTLPANVTRLFCAANRGGELRWVNSRTSCNTREFLVSLASKAGVSQDTNPGDPVANADQGTTDEDHATTVAVLGNDKNTASSNSNAGLQVASTDTTGTKGNVTVNPDGTIGYDPNGQFESLKAGQTATDTLKYRAKKGSHTSAPATVTITINGVNDLPVAKDDSASTDSAHTKSIPVLANDTDADGDTLTVSSVDTSATQGSVTTNGDGTVTYDPNHKFDSLAPGDTAHDTFKYKANDGHGDSNAATVDVTITGVNDPPVVTTTSGSTAYTENAPGVAIDGGLTVTDPDSAQLSSATVSVTTGFNGGDQLGYTSPGPGGITGSYDSGTGVLTLTGPGSPADFQAAFRSVKFSSTNDNPSTAKTVEFKANDGNSDSAAATKQVAVTPVNDAPVTDLNGTGNAGFDATAAFTEDSPAASVAPNANVSDPDNVNLASATVTLTNHPDGSAESLSVDTAGTSITAAAYNTATGVLALSGSDTVAHYQQVVRSLKYDNSSNTPDTTDRVVNVKVNDGAAESNEPHSTVSVAAHNDAPTATDQSGLTTNEDTGLPVTLAGTDPEGDSLTFTHDSASAHGGTITGIGSSVNYQPAADYCGPDSFGFAVDDGHGGTDTGTVSIGVTCVNDAPVTDLNGTGNPGFDATASFTEDSPAASVAPNTDITDVDSTNLASATITLTNHPNGAAESLSVNTAGTAITASAYDSTNGVLTLSGSDTVANYQQVIRSLKYNNTSNTPDTTDRVVNVKVNDGSLDSNEPHSTVSVTAHNDAPTATDQTLSATEDTVKPVTLSGTDPEGDSLNFTHDSTSAEGGAISGAGANVTYTPAQDFCGQDSFNFTADDGNGGTDQGTISLTVTCVNDAPVTDLNGTGTAGFDTTASFTEGSPPANVTPSADLTDVDNTSLSSATITLVSRPDGNAKESLAVTIPGGSPVTSSGYDSSTGVITLAGNGATIAEMQAVIRSLTYNDTSNNPSSANRSVTVKVNDGSLDSNTATSVVSVTPVNNAPVAVADSYSTNEDTPLTVAAPGVLGNDSDVDSGSITAVLVTGPSNGSLTLNADGSFDYTPNQDFNGSDSFTYKANDGSADSNVVTVDITVNAVNDAPVVDLNGPAAGTGTSPSFAEQIAHTGGATTLAPNGTITDVDSPNLSSLTVTLTNHPNNSSEFLTADTSGTTITADSYDPTTGVLLLHGTDLVTNYQKVLRTVAYENDAAPPNPTTRTINFVANDGGADSNTAVSSVSVVPIDAAPVTDLNGSANPGFDSTPSFTEDAGPATLAPNAEVTDADTANMASATITLTNHPNTSFESLAANVTGTSITADAYDPTSGVLFLHGSDTQAHYQQVLRTVTYNNTSNTPNTASRSITFKVNDGQEDSNVATATTSVAATNDAPTLDLNGNANAGVNTTAVFTEDQPAVTLAPNALADDVDNANLQSATVTLTNRPDTTAESLVANVTGTSITADAYDPTTGVLFLHGSDTLAHYSQVLQSVKYNNTSQNANTASRVVNFVVNDSSADSNSPTSTVTIHVVNDPPVVDMTGGSGPGIDTSIGFIEDSPPAHPGNGPLALGSSATVSDVDNTTLSSATLTLETHPDGTLESLSVNVSGTSITTTGYDPTSGVLQLSGSDTVAHYQQVIRSAKYNNTSNTPDPTSRTADILVSDGSANSTVAHTTISVTPTNDAPTAGTDSFTSTQSAVGNTTLAVDDTTNHGGTADGPPATPDPTDTSPVINRPHKGITGDILANDSDPESSNSTLTLTPGTFNTHDGGTVTIQADGDFTFEPKPSTSCTDHSDFFNYTVNDNTGGDNQTATGTVNVDIAGCVWYVNNDDAQGNDGTSEKPFDTVAQAQTASSAGDSIFVYGGNGTTGYNAGVSLKNTQQLIGEAADLVVGTDTLHSADSANKPTLSNNNADVVSLANANVVKGLTIDPQGTGGGICGGTACGGNATAGGTIDDVQITDSGTKGTQPGLELNGSTGTFSISNFTVNNGDGSSATSTDEGVKLNNAGTVNFASTGTISLTTNGAAALDAAAGGGTTSLGSGSTFDDITTTNSPNGGVVLNGTTGSGTAFGDGSGTDLSLTTVSGSTAAFSAQTAGSFSVDAAGTDNVSATGGPAVDVTNSSGSTMAWDDVSSTNSASTGVNLSGLGAGTFSAASGSTISGEAGTGFALNGGSGDVTYPGTFNNGSGNLVASVQNRTNGNVSLSGNMNDTNDTGGGLSVASNSGGTITFSGTTKQFNTGSSDGVNLNSNTGTSIDLAGGGLAIDTTTGKGLTATGGGTVTVQGSTNTINSTNATALNVVSTTIGNSDLNFQSISSGNNDAGADPANGIALNTTSNANGKLIVSGNASAGTGGTIQHATDSDIKLTSVPGGVSLSRMNITNAAEDGINGSSVAGLNVDNSAISSNGDGTFGAGDGDRGVDMTNLTGTNTFNTDTFNANKTDGLVITNTTGSSNTTVTGGTYSNTVANDGVREVVSSSTGGPHTLDVEGGSYSNNNGDQVQMNNDSTSSSVQANLTVNNITATSPVTATGGTPPFAGGGITASTSSSGTLNADVTNNTITGANASPINFTVHTGSNTINGTATGNTLRSNSADGIQIDSAGATGSPQLNTLITNNTITGSPPGTANGFNTAGIEIFQSGSTNIQATVQGNTTHDPRTTALNGIRAQAGQTGSSDSGTLCLDLGSSTNAALKNDATGGGAFGGQADIRLIQRGNTTFRLPGYTGANNDTTAVANYLAARNSGSTQALFNAAPGYTNTSPAGSSCTQP